VTAVHRRAVAVVALLAAIALQEAVTAVLDVLTQLAHGGANKACLHLTGRRAAVVVRRIAVVALLAGADRGVTTRGVLNRDAGAGATRASGAAKVRFHRARGGAAGAVGGAAVVTRFRTTHDAVAAGDRGDAGRAHGVAGEIGLQITGTRADVARTGITVITLLARVELPVSAQRATAAGIVRAPTGAAGTAGGACCRRFVDKAAGVARDTRSLFQVAGAATAVVIIVIADAA